MEAIKTVEQLIYNLNMGPGYEGYSGLLRAVELTSDELNELCIWPNGHYARIRIYDTDCVEALLTCWPAGIKGPIHNYENQQGYVKMLSGELMLDFYNVGKGQAVSYATRLLKKGEQTYLNDGIGFHQFSNNSTEPAIAFHLYFDKITEWHEFDESTGSIKLVPTACHLEIDRPAK